MDAGSFIVEDCLSRADVHEEIAHLESLSEHEHGDVTACMISFLSRGRRRDRDAAKLGSASVIGQVCVISFPTEAGPRSYIYEAIFRLPCKGPQNEQLLNNHVPIAGELEILIRGTPHRFLATYFCQQNGISSICAHSAVRTLVRTLKGKHVATCELNSFWKFDPDTRPVRTDKVEAALEKYGFRPVLYDLSTRVAQTVSDYQPDNVWGLLTLLADSGSPALLTLSEGEPADHVVPILGHTFNSDEWHPLGTTLHREGEDSISSSHLWIDHLVMHDDMLGPYYCLSRAGLFSGQNKRKLTPQLVIAMLPEKVEVSPAQAEDFARESIESVLRVVRDSNLGSGRWWDFLLTKRERRVFRTTLVDRDEYLASLEADITKAGISNSPKRNADTLKRMRTALPEQMWMCEITLPNLLLANRAKLGELLIDAKEFPNTRDDLLRCLKGFRLPSMIAWSENGKDGAHLVGTKWDVDGHVPIHAPHHHRNRW